MGENLVECSVVEILEERQKKTKTKKNTRKNKNI